MPVRIDFDSALDRKPAPVSNKGARLERFVLESQHRTPNNVAPLLIVRELRQLERKNRGRRTVRLGQNIVGV